jgi:hypothetical protein
VAVRELDLLCEMLGKGGGRFMTAGALAEEYCLSKMQKT